MKNVLISFFPVITCLMFTGTATHAATEVKSVFHLKARVPVLTCDPTLETSGDITGNTINFGIVSEVNESYDTKKSIVLKLRCSDDFYIPSRVKISFNVIGGLTDDSLNSILYPQTNVYIQPQKNLYYQWTWGKDINNAFYSDGIKNYAGSNIDLKSTTQYNLKTYTDLSSITIPIDITQHVKTSKMNKTGLKSGVYTSSVIINIQYL